MKLTKNFTRQEFDCNDGTKVPEGFMHNLQVLANNLQVLRDHIDKPIFINSGYRSPTHNKKIGGAKSSKHMLAQAADIVVSGMTPKDVADTIEELIKQGKMKQGGLGRYNTFTHYDVRGSKARWNG